jgi:uncharacterized membrane protein YdjX (TVP38/TMEM64 family)
MDGKTRQPLLRRKRGIWKAMFLTAFIGAAVYLVHFTPLRDFLSREALSHFFEEAGFWAPVFFIIFYTVGACLFIPGALLTAIGAAIFGAYWGFVYVWIGAMGGSSAAFWIGRTLGREFAASLVGDRLKKYDDAIERNGFTTVLYLRLVYFPFTPMNFGMGLTKVRFWDYFEGTGLGMLVGIFVFTFFIGSLKEVWASGDWSQLFSIKIFLAVGLFIFSLLIPRFLKKRGS